MGYSVKAAQPALNRLVGVRIPVPQFFFFFSSPLGRVFASFFFPILNRLRFSLLDFLLLVSRFFAILRFFWFFWFFWFFRRSSPFFAKSGGRSRGTRREKTNREARNRRTRTLQKQRQKDARQKEKKKRETRPVGSFEGPRFLRSTRFVVFFRFDVSQLSSARRRNEKNLSRSIVSNQAAVKRKQSLHQRRRVCLNITTSLSF